MIIKDDDDDDVDCDWKQDQENNNDKDNDDDKLSLLDETILFLFKMAFTIHPVAVMENVRCREND